jgi:NAD(P)H-hydrate epimerase
MMKVVTSEQMRRIEARCEAAGVSTDSLMEKAGLAVAKRVRHHLGHLTGVHILVLVGPGNNGGDGLVAARHLRRWGARVTCYLCLDRREPDPKLAGALEQGVRIINASADDGLTALDETLASAHMVVDAVLGTGRSRAIEGLLKNVLTKVSEVVSTRHDLRIAALDLPSGLDADTGEADPACLAADVTVALGYPKVGLYAYAAADRIGAIEVVDIGIPEGLDDNVGLELMTSGWARSALPRRPSAAHKGDFGRTLVVAGSRNYVGAAYLAATAATRVGAGLVTIAIPESLQAAVAAKATEPTYLPLPESRSGGLDSEAAGALIARSMDGYDALLVGCGLGQTPGTRALVERLLCSGQPLPGTVVDADGLNILAAGKADDQPWWERFSEKAIITPHTGEMARLTGESTDAIQRDRVGQTLLWAERWNKITVLKGAHTVVGFPTGRAMISPFANPGLASAGTGDVLAGAIAGLQSQGLGLEEAAALGVFLHGEAGERVRAELGDTGSVAGDLLNALPRVIRELRAGAP